LSVHEYLDKSSFDFSTFCILDKQQHHDPFVLQLTTGSVEEVSLKGHEHCIKLTNGENQMYLNFNNTVDYNTWLTRCKKVKWFYHHHYYYNTWLTWCTKMKSQNDLFVLYS